MSRTLFGNSKRLCSLRGAFVLIFIGSVTARQCNRRTALLPTRRKRDDVQETEPCPWADVWPEAHGANFISTSSSLDWKTKRGGLQRSPATCNQTNLVGSNLFRLAGVCLLKAPRSRIVSCPEPMLFHNVASLACRPACDRISTCGPSCHPCLA